MTFNLLLVGLCTLLGLLLSRTSLCTVAGVQGCLKARDFSGLRPIVAATCAAGLGLMAIALVRPAQVLLPQQHPAGLALLAGGGLLGAGALLNGACYLGSVLYVGRGNPNFLLTLAGLGLAARSAAAPMAAPGHGAGRVFDVPHAVAAGVLFALLLVLSARALRGAALYAAAGAGLVAAFIYAWHPAWSYGVVIETLAHAHTGMMTGLASALMLFAGATLGALLQHRWRLAPLEPLRAARCLAGGFVMGWGAHLVPGGNDMLLLWAIPGLALYGLLAYLVMLVTVAALLCLPQLLRPAASGAQLPP